MLRLPLSRFAWVPLLARSGPVGQPVDSDSPRFGCDGCHSSIVELVLGGEGSTRRGIGATRSDRLLPADFILEGR